MKITLLKAVTYAFVFFAIILSASLTLLTIIIGTYLILNLKFSIIIFVTFIALICTIVCLAGKYSKKISNKAIEEFEQEFKEQK